MKIAIVGANGQVASEVALLLTTTPGVEVVPICRTDGGSAFLRSLGIKVVHGDISNKEDALRLLEGADLVANFALALGSPRESLLRNSQIIDQIYAASPAGAKHIFISTISVDGEFDVRGKKRSSFYGYLKRMNEEQVLSLTRRKSLSTHVFRLGHVIGPFQNISNQIRQEIRDGAAYIPFPDRPANVSSTIAIADALIQVGRGAAGPGGVFDLLNRPQWTWRDVYESEARYDGLKLDARALGVGEIRHRHWGWIPALAAKVITPSLRERLLRLLAFAHPSLEGRLRATYSVLRARHAAAPLSRKPVIRNAGLVTPPRQARVASGQRATLDLIDNAPDWYRKGPPPKGQFLS